MLPPLVIFQHFISLLQFVHCLEIQLLDGGLVNRILNRTTLQVQFHRADGERWPEQLNGESALAGDVGAASATCYTTICIVPFSEAWFLN